MSRRARLIEAADYIEMHSLAVAIAWMLRDDIVRSDWAQPDADSIRDQLQTYRFSAGLIGLLCITKVVALPYAWDCPTSVPLINQLS